MVAASDMLMHHMLIILTLTFIQGHTDLDHENNKCLIISETIQAMPIKFAVMMVRLKVIKIWDHYQSDDLDLHWTALYNLQYLGQNLSYYIQTWHDGRPMHGIYARARIVELELDFENIFKAGACSFLLSVFCWCLGAQNVMLLFPQVSMRTTVFQSPAVTPHPPTTCPHWRAMKTTLLVWRRWIKVPPKSSSCVRVTEQWGKVGQRQLLIE